MTTNILPLNPVLLRAQFPALQLEVNGETAVFLNGPSGTQSPQSVIDAMSGYLAYGSSNLGGPFLTSRHADAVVAEARKKSALART
jgi:selenocysteine lyase/cysteine desulfurase